MDRSRRSFLKGLACAGATAAASAAPAAASEPRQAPDDAVGMLYDTTRCIGCKTCVVACHEANDLPPDDRGNGLHDAPQALNDRTKNIIKLFKDENQRSSDEEDSACCQGGRSHGPIASTERIREPGSSVREPCGS